MASFEKSISKNLFDNFLPAFGNPRVHIPTWDNGQKMFLCDEHESPSGNRYYCGVRFCDRIAIVEKVGLFHSFTYIDSIELYAFNGEKPELIQKRDYTKAYRNEEFIRTESEDMVKDYLSGLVKMQHLAVSEEETENHAKSLVERSYKSFLDSDFDIRLTQILPLIEQK